MKLVLNQIWNVGPFDKIDRNSIRKLSRISVVYGPNGTGKTSLKTSLASCFEPEERRPWDEKTLGKEKEQFKISVSDDQNNTSSITDQQRNTLPYNLLCFDQDFIRKNVMTTQVETGHESELAELLLGEQGISAKRELDRLEESRNAKQAELNELRNRLEDAYGFRITGKFTDVLTSLQNVTESYDSLRAHLITKEEELRSVKQAREIARLRIAEEVDYFFSDLDMFKQACQRDFNSIVDEASRKRVRNHVEHRLAGKQNGEKLIEISVRFDDGSTCPVCGQGIELNELFDAYRAYFNEEVTKLQEFFRSWADSLLNIKSSSEYQALDRTATVLAERGIQAKQYNSQLGDLDQEAEDIRENLVRIAEQVKTIGEECYRQIDQVNFEAVSQEKDRIVNLVSQLNYQVERFSGAKQRLNDWVSNVVDIDVESEINRLSSEVNGCRQKLKAYDNEFLKELERGMQLEKDIAEISETGKQKDQAARYAMHRSLDAQKNEINRILEDLESPLLVEDFDSRFDRKRKNPVFAQYTLRLRGRNVKGRGGKKERGMGQILSEGEKNALAFAFFAASALSKVRNSGGEYYFLLVDDPVSSFDEERKKLYAEVLCELCREVGGAAILSHEKDFVLFLADKVDRNRNFAKIRGDVGYYRLTTNDSALTLSEFSVTKEKRGEFKRLREKIENASQESSMTEERAKDIAGDIRILIELYLDMRYGRLLSDPGRLGENISWLQRNGYVTEDTGKILESLRAFSAPHHHGSNDYDEMARADFMEVRANARKCLQLVEGAR